MTMRVSITNNDDNRTAEIITREFGVGESIPSVTSTEQLGPHKSVAIHIHAGKQILITENPNALQPEPTK